MCQGNHTTAYKFLSFFASMHLPTAYFKIPNKSFRALVYYPLILTIGLIIWVIYGILIMFGFIIKNKIVPQSEVRVFLNYPSLFLPKPYINFIKNGINWDQLMGFESKVHLINYGQSLGHGSFKTLNNKGCPRCGSNNIFGLETLNECDDCGTYF